MRAAPLREFRVGAEGHFNVWEDGRCLRKGRGLVEQGQDEAEDEKGRFRQKSRLVKYSCRSSRQ